MRSGAVLNQSVFTLEILLLLWGAKAVESSETPLQSGTLVALRLQ